MKAENKNEVAPIEARNSRKVREGIVVSNKMAKTIVVAVRDKANTHFIKRQSTKPPNLRHTMKATRQE